MKYDSFVTKTRKSLCGVIAAVLLSVLAAEPSYAVSTDSCTTAEFDARFDVTSVNYDITAITAHFNTPSCNFFGFFSSQPAFSVAAGGGVIAIEQLVERQDVNFLMGVANGANPATPGVDSLVLFTNPEWALNAAGKSFEDLFPGFDKALLIDSLLTFTGIGPFEMARQALFDFNVVQQLGPGGIGFRLGEPFSIVAFSTAVLIGEGESALIPAPAGIPEPASWAMLIAGFGLTGAVLRRRRHAAA